jgi:glutamate/aspartate transport system permease protein
LTIIATIGGGYFEVLLLALMRLSGKKILMVSATVYVNGMRSPLVMGILWFFLLYPRVSTPGATTGQRYPPSSPSWRLKRPTSAKSCGRVFQSISRSKPMPVAPGMTYSQNMRLIILPQAFRNMVPILLTQTIILFQDTPGYGWRYDLLKASARPAKSMVARKRPYLLAAGVCDVFWPVLPGQKNCEQIAIIR